MDSAHIYQKIAESIRQEIMCGDLQSGDRLPTVREMAARWGCTPGTVQRAYKELTRQGLVVSRPGWGTRVASAFQVGEVTPLRQAALIHQAEAFLLEVLTAGHTPAEVERAVRIALDRWRAVAQEPRSRPAQQLRFVGSHDPAVALVASCFMEAFPEYALDLTFSTSLGGLIALAEEKADVAGCHLWDEESEGYNKPFVRRLLPGWRVALLTLAHRHLGLITSPGNPTGVRTLTDLAQPGISFINRPRGSGTRVWFDAQLRQRGIKPSAVNGYWREATTHSEVACMVAEGQADVGVGVEAAARAYHLEFSLLTKERYDLVIPYTVWGTPPAQALVDCIANEEVMTAIGTLGGYDIDQTGRVEWINGSP